MNSISAREFLDEWKHRRLKRFRRLDKANSIEILASEFMKVGKSFYRGNLRAKVD